MQTVPRLYESFQPSHYDLKLTLEREKRTFHGIVTISGEKIFDDQPITFHAKSLAITKIFIDGTPQDGYALDENDALTLKDSAPVGTHVVTIEFNGKITDPMHGLYPCYYEHNGIKKELLATQFESHHAREVFPCVDEPEAKATFDLTLTTETGVTVLGNMPIKESRDTSQEIRETTFETSPRMSPYLLAFVVGELHGKSAKTKSGVDVNVWATPAQAPDSLNFALDVAVKSIEFFDDYFDTPYPLPKADHVALPDFSSGAMENWGLITYREICLLVDERSSVSSRQYVATVIAHETSHQWFGNLVTMKWWDDLWLNESFATLMEYLCVDALFPGWEIWMTFATSETLSAVRRDYLPGVQPVRVEVNHPDEISTLFDPSIVYAKGARLLAMLHRYVGEEAFRDGLKHYFKEHAYKNTIGQDLWDALSTSSHHDIAGFMTPWLTQPGLPIVSITRTSLSQKRFVLGGDNPTPDTTWPIPLASNQSEIPELFADATLSLPRLPEDTRINTGGRSHFISHYDDEDLLAFRIAAIASGAEINPADRLTLLNDASLLARGAYISARNLFELATAYQNEASEPVWDIIALVISDLKRFVEDHEVVEKKFKFHITQLARQSHERLGWDPKENESESDTKLRATIIGLLAYSDDRAIIKKSLNVYHAAKDLLSIPGEIRGIIFSVVAKHGTPEDIERLIAAHKQTHIAELQGDIAGGLTATHDTNLIARLISFLKDETIVRSQDLTRWFIYLMRNRHAREQTWQWLVDNWDWLEAKFAGDKSYDDFVRYSASALSTYAWLERYQEFWTAKKEIPALKRAIELGESDIAARAEWIKRDKSAFLESL